MDGFWDPSQDERAVYGDRELGITIGSEGTWTDGEFFLGGGERITENTLIQVAVD